MHKLISSSPIQTEEIGEKIGKTLKPGDLVCLSGDLGVGKTEFVKGMASGIGIKDYITSPTFTIVNEYYGDKKLFHFDVYRVSEPEELYEIGFEEYIYSDAICVIEWAELIQKILPKEKIWIQIRKDYSQGEDYREIIIETFGQRFDNLIEKLNLGSENNENISN